MGEVSTPFNVVAGASGFAEGEVREQNLTQSAADLVHTSGGRETITVVRGQRSNQLNYVPNRGISNLA
jgi:hypothetical protein